MTRRRLRMLIVELGLRVHCLSEIHGAINGETEGMVGSPMSTCLNHWQGISGYFYVKNGLIPGSLDDSTQVQVLGIFVYSRLFVFEGRESVEYDR